MGAGTVALVLATLVPACAPNSPDVGIGVAASDPHADPNGLTGEFVTYVADKRDGTTEWWHAVRTSDGREVRLDFDTPTLTATGTQVTIHGDMVGANMHVSSIEALAPLQIAAASDSTEPPTYAATSPDSYALVLVDLGSGVDLTADQALPYLSSATSTAKSFAAYYNEVSYGKYQVTGSVIGPYPFSMTTCDTTGMYKAIEPMITGTYNHLIYYFKSTNLCDFGGLGEEGSALKPAKRTWMNGSLSCVVLMQEPGHNLGLMHANTMKCGTSSFSTTPSTCTITEYGSSMSTMGGGCKQFNAYERWYMQWLTGCNGVKVPADGTFNLQPLESNCSSGTGIQVLQVPFPATLTVSDPQSTGTAVSLNNYYVELRTAGGLYDAYATKAPSSGVVFTAPTVFIYASDNVKLPTTGTRGTTQSNSVWTELLNMNPTSNAFAGLTTVGQSFVDPAGGPTITLTSISATGATVSVTYPGGGTGSPTCIDGTALTAPGPTSCAASTTGAAGATGTGGTTTGTGGATGAAGAKGTGGATGAAGAKGTGGTTTTGAAGAKGTGGATTTGTGGTTTGAAGASGKGGATGTGGTVVTGSGGATGTGGTTTTGTGGATGTGGTTTTGTGNSTGSGGTTPSETGSVSGGCSCSVDAAHPAGSTQGLWLTMTGLTGLVFVRRPRKRT